VIGDARSVFAVVLAVLLANGCASWQEPTAAVAPTMTDSDGDGVGDDADECPGTPAGVAVDAAGCPRYTDADEVPDYLDECPGTPAGVRVAATGCPLDSDEDKVSDYLDRCPDTPAGAEVDRRGCSTGTVPMSIATSINFDFDSARIPANAADKLGRVINVIEKSPSIKVRIVGHTDDRGPAQYNVGLSLRRAAAVKEYMTTRGIDSVRLSILGKGESEPLAPNTTPDSRATNRRVEFEIVP